VKKHPTISICIANYNGKNVIDDCINSVLQQTDAPEMEIIVHDDASSDQSASHIRENYPEIHLIESSKNVGYCVANNRMVDMAQGDYILLLNNDAALYHDAITTLYHSALELKLPAVLGLPQYDFNTGELIDIGSLFDPFLNPVPNLNPLKRDVGMVIGACLWIPKKTWKELGGFPEWFNSIGEDLHICCLARLAGYQVKALGNSGYRHHVGLSFGGGKLLANKLSTTFQRRALSEKNKTYVMAMTYPTPFMQIILPIHLLLQLAEGITLSILRLSSTYLRKIYLPVFYAIIQERRKILTTRRSIMLSNNLSYSNYFAVFDWKPHKLTMLLKHGLPRLS
jgi:GT2 family glycosyltransferase